MANITWIPVEYELPKENGDYLVAVKDTNPIEYLDGIDDLSRVEMMHYDADQMIFNDQRNWYWNMLKFQVPNHYYIITHWMPLPDLPFEKVVKK